MDKLEKLMQKNTNKTHNSLSRSRLVNVVFTFNVSARCFTAASPIALSNWTTKGAKCLRTQQHSKIKRRANTAIHLHASKNTVKVVFTFNASPICAAPSTAISFPVYIQEIVRMRAKNHSLTTKVNAIYCIVHC